MKNKISDCQFTEALRASGYNSTQAYLSLRPSVTYGSARVLGSRMLAKVKKSLAKEQVRQVKIWFQQLSDGLGAVDIAGQPDHRTRFLYLTKLGRILDLE